MRIRGSGNPPQNSEKEQSASQRYEVLNRHGEGALFIVYRVRDRASLSIYALKALRGSHAHHPEFLAAWHEIARAAERRQLPHIASVFESGTEKATPYLVEEWLPDGSLEDRLRRAPFNRTKTEDLACDMATALAELHDNGEVHGDFRPRQVLFDKSGALKINDVGWEYAVHRNGLAAVDIFPDAAYYTAPEIWEGHPVTPASDIYALGAVLYRMLAGRVPFDGTSPIAIGGRHRHTPVMRPSQFNPSCALQLEEIAVGMLSKNPQDRIAPFRQLLTLRSAPQENIPPQVIKKTEPQEETPNRPQKQKKRNKNQPKTRKELGKKELKGALLAFFWAIIAIGMLGGIVSGAVYFWMQSTPTEVQVPDYIGMSYKDAVPLLQQKGLELEIGREIYDPDQPSDTVIDGTPHPGTNVRSGRKIVVTVSKGKEPIRMYDFRDLTLEQARRIMGKHGLRLGQITNQYDNKIPKDVIITQFPQPGQYVRRDDPVSLMISRGPFPTTEVRPTDREETVPSEDDRRTTYPEDDADEQGVDSEEDSDLLTSENVQVKVNIPDSAAAQLVNIVVDDATGEHTVYSATVRPGSTINETVRIARSSKNKATVRVYAGGELLQEMDF